MSNDAFHPMAAQVEHITLATNDVERLCDFYRQLGAMASPVVTDPCTGLGSGVLDFCGVRLELRERPAGRDGGDPSRLAPGVGRRGFGLGCPDAPQRRA